MEFGESATLSYPLIEDEDTPRQKADTVDCAVYVMRYIEQILDNQKLRIPHTDVPYLRLKYVATILKEGSAAGIFEKGDTSTGWEKK